MTNPNLSGSGFRGALSCRSILSVAFLAIPLVTLGAQEHEEDHDHDHLHFSHPLVTESPSPDTKVRLDYIYTLNRGTGGGRGGAIRIEGEYAFNHSVSLAIVTPFISRREPATARVSGLGNIELSLKGASLAF